MSKAKRDYLKTEFENNVKNSKNVWHLLSELLPGKKDTSKMIQLLDDNDEMIENERLAHHINSHFNTVGSKNPIPPIPTQGPIPYPVFDLQPINTIDMIEIIKKIDIKKASSVINLPTILLKEVFVSNPNIMTNMINKCILSKTLPKKWKNATIIPLKKVKNCTSCGDLRPISLLPLPSKLLEKIIYKQCIDHLIHCNLFNPEQFGFQKDKSTISAISEFTDDIYENVENNNPTIAIYIDFQKAFDRLNHDILLHKLRFFAFSENTIEFFKNYLGNRTHTTLVNNRTSGPLQLTHGVPQGSNLGPMLFLLYINDINLNINNSSIKLFADDTPINNSKKY